MAQLVDLVKIICNTTGPGAITLGGASAGYRGVEVLVNGTVYSYAIQQASNYEYGRGTYLAAGRQLIRSPIASSAGGVAVDLQPNAAVALVALAEDLTDLINETMALETVRQIISAGVNQVQGAAGGIVASISAARDAALAQIAAAGPFAAQVRVAPSKPDLADADAFALLDSSNTFSPGKISWSDLRSLIRGEIQAALVSAGLITPKTITAEDGTILTAEDGTILTT